MVYNPRKLSVVINENIGYLIEREKINKQYIYSNLGIMKIVHDPNANVSLEKLEQLADLLNTNVPNLVTDWEKGLISRRVWDVYKRIQGRVWRLHQG